MDMNKINGSVKMKVSAGNSATAHTLGRSQQLPNKLIILLLLKYLLFLSSK